MIKSKDGKTSWASGDDMIASFLAAATPGRSKPATPATPATPKKAEKKKRCPKGKIRNKKTGLCEKKSIPRANTFGEKQGNWRGTSGSVPIPPKPKVNNLKKFLPDKILSFAEFQQNLNLGK